MKFALLCQYPDLAGHLAAAGDLTSESEEEHKAAGLDRLTPEQTVRISVLNQRQET